MADKRNRTPFYGAVPTSKLNADHVFMADGRTVQEAVKDTNAYDYIESIETINDWTVEKWISGKCVTYKNIPTTESIGGWTQEGNLYYKVLYIDLPADTFITEPTYFNAVVCSSNLVFYCPLNVTNINVSGYMTASYNYGARSYQIKCLAIGRWK